MKRLISIPDAYTAMIDHELRRMGYRLDNPTQLAKAVLRLSDFYLASPLAPTPWHEEWARAAAICYYFPLNYARNSAVRMEASRLGFFSGLEQIVDVGCGAGAGLLAFLDGWSDAVSPLAPFAADRSGDAVTICNSLGGGRVTALRNDAESERSLPDVIRARSTLLLASYLYTELPSIPPWWLEIEALAIVEPSTHQDARRLQALRQELIDVGFSIWAPCTHMQACPLLTHSLKDWCHDRIHWSGPTWFSEIEKRLPIKNRTLTFSYVLARRSKKSPHALASAARLVGDTLHEKGKCRQAVCRGPEREFLAWFPKRLPGSTEIDLQRGSLVRLASGLEKKAAELRLPTANSITEIHPSEPI